MSKLDIMDYIICTAVLCYGICPIVQNARPSLANEKVGKEYLSKHKDGYTMVSQYLPYMTFFLGFPVTGIIGISAMEKNTKDELYVCFALALMAIINAGIVFDSTVKRRATADDGGFVYEKAHYRFRFTPSTDPMKSIIKNIDIPTTECQHVVVSKKMGVHLHECFLAWKEHKKDKGK